MTSEKTIIDFNNLLKSRSATVFCAESITAGLLASTIASVPGASSVLLGGIVTYSADVKIRLLNVPKEIIKEHSAESQETTNEMCSGIKKLYPDATIHVAVTGVASPPSNDYKVSKPVGQIYISIFYKRLYEYNTIIPTTDSLNKREEIRHKTVLIIIQKITDLLNDV